MSVKDLFDKGHSLKFIRKQTHNDVRDDVESKRFIEAYSEKRRRFFPNVDFTTASNFARYGSAELYYDSAIKRIYQTYPYDGSLAEKTEWENDSNYLDAFIFQNEYPRVNGHITLNSGSNTYTAESSLNVYSSSAPQYILFSGGPHADPAGNFKDPVASGPEQPGVSKVNIYEASSARTNNLELDLAKGITFEFWLKKDSWVDTSTVKYEYLFNLVASGATGDQYGNLRVYCNGVSKDDLRLIINSGSTELEFLHETGLSGQGIADGKWRHYAFTAAITGSSTISKMYLDGVLKSSVIDSDTINPIDGKMVAAIGALAGPKAINLAQAGRGWGNAVDAHFDEFRYWKTERNAQDIGRFYRQQIGGGTNTDNIKYDKVHNPVDLGVYYKFNEGITGQPNTDSIILDYSGRISNGDFINYDSTTSRNLSSAMVTAGASPAEFKDPILYSFHPEVSAYHTAKLTSGSFWDEENSAMLLKSFPGWITEEDEQKSNNLKYMVQIISSFFDDVYLQMESLPRLKDINYPYDNDPKYEKPLAFADRLLTHRGIEAPELFADASLLAKYLNRDEQRLFEKKLYDVKNTIYQNIYNNLTYLQKTKGTLKSLRNFLRCFGVDEDLVKLNIYASGETFELKDNFTYTSLRKKYIDFDDLETRYEKTGKYINSFESTAYQYYDTGITDSLSYIPGISRALASGSSATMEVEVIFPKRHVANDDNYNLFPGYDSSIFGLHGVKPSNTDLSYLDGTGADVGTDDINFHLKVQKSKNDKRDGKFVLSTTAPSNGDHVFPELETASSYSRIYDNEKWNFAVRLRPSKNHGGLVTGSFEPISSAYVLELYGVNYLSNILQEEFVLSSSISFETAIKFFERPKRIFAGARRNNFTGSVATHSDVKVASVRYWHDYLTNDTIKAHALDSFTYGAGNPYKNDNFFSKFSHKSIPQIEKLVMDWTVENVTASGRSGEFSITDFSSGSRGNSSNRYGDYRTLLNSHYPAKGDFFVTGSDQAVDVEFVPTGKQKLPEIVNSDDMVKVLNRFDDVNFIRDTTYVQHHLSVEKSMYQVISEEMLRFFATIVDFNNLIGEPVNRYRPNYKKIDKLRDLFFEKVEEAPDLDKFIEYYKWIDDAVSLMIFQLIPASTNKVEVLRNMVESHILERNKYWSKFPTLDNKTREPFDPILGINEMLYNWKFGHVNPGSTESDSCLWWKSRAERGILYVDPGSVDPSKTTLSSSVVDVNNTKNTLLRRINTTSPVVGTNMRPQDDPTFFTDGGDSYSAPTYKIRALSRPVRIEKDRALTLKGGPNSKVNKKYDLYKNAVKWASDDDFLFMDLDNQLPIKDCNDQYTPEELNKKIAYFKSSIETAGDLTDTVLGGNTARAEYDDLKSEQLFPFSIYTSSIEDGYKKPGYINALGTNAQFRTDFNNYHHDYYGPDAEIPMQGPFTRANVGGMQHRHAEINRYSTLKGNFNNLDSALDRAEGWALYNNLTRPRSLESQYILNEYFHAGTYAGHQDHVQLRGGNSDTAGGMHGNVYLEPSAYEMWAGGVDCGTLHAWTFKRGTTPSFGTGPTVSASERFAYCEVLPEYAQQTFGLRTPLIDFLDLSTDSGEVYFKFDYHMHGVNIGTLKAQASTDPTFASDVTDILLRWDHSGTPSQATSLTGEQHASSTDAFKSAYATANYPSYGNGLQDFLGKRFYIRFLYTAGIGHLGDCAIDNVAIYQGDSAKQNKGDSWRLLHPTHDNISQPHAMLFREEVAKRPVNIRNIEITSSSPTKAGNYFHRYQYLNIGNRAANDPWFVKNHTEVSSRTSSMGPLSMIGTGSSITNILNTRLDPVVGGRAPSTDSFVLPEREFLSGTVRNKTRFVAHFSSPGDHESLSRGYLDREHESFSVYNAMPWRNRFIRQQHTSQLTAHMGKFGTSTHGPTSTSARVFGDEVVGSTRSDDYSINGDAARHKYHSNSVQRIEQSSSYGIASSKGASFNGTNDYLAVADNITLQFGATSADGAFSISAWVQMTDATNFPIIEKVNHGSSLYEWRLYVSTDDKLYFKCMDETESVYEAVRSDSALTSYQGLWTHIVATADTAGESKGMKLYINGAEIASTRFDAGSYTAMHNTAAGLSIGKYDTGSPLFARGGMDEISIWNRALSDEDVLEIYNGCPKQETATSNVSKIINPGSGDLTNHSAAQHLQAWWRLGDSGDTVESDSSLTTSIDRKNSNNATGYGTGPTVFTLGVPPAIFEQMVTGSTHDNGFVSHMIPRTDFQYAWITASII
tara:strand:+ start:9487 stop:16245 length:6759 start_codon:yes stop_codon:yes gene_type:complete